MTEGLKVLMMGGQRVGKSSALAALMDAFMKAPINTLLQAKDTTELAKNDNEQQESINLKLSEIKSFLRKNKGKTVLVDSGKTSTIWHYKLELSLPDSNKTMEILFTDVNGEFYEGGNLHQEDICKFIEEYDVFIIAIDTTYIMESVNPNNEYVDEIINEKFNFVDDIQSFMSSINAQNCTDAKLVIFAPIKCEKWAHDNALELVVKRTKEVYKTVIANLEACSNVIIEFLPIQTIGTLVFKEHLPAMSFTWKKTFLLFFKKIMTQKCSIISPDEVRLSDGKIMQNSIGSITDDYSAILIPDTDIIRPNSWFEVTSSDYAPHNCEQLALHILDFMLRKFIDARVRKVRDMSPLERFGYRALNKIPIIKKFFGDIPIEKVERAINSLKSDSIIKYSGEGIEVYKDIELLTQ